MTMWLFLKVDFPALAGLKRAVVCGPHARPAGFASRTDAGAIEPPVAAPRGARATGGSGSDLAVVDDDDRVRGCERVRRSR
jgi:hypothetical protein